MQALMRLWQKMGPPSARQAWGLASDGPQWVLVGLSRAGADLLKVQSTTMVQAENGAASLSQTLIEMGHRKLGMPQKVAMSLDAPDLVTGQLHCPVGLPEEDWPAEVQLEVAQALNLPPDEVNFDFEAEAWASGLVRHIHWAGCAKARVAEFQQWTAQAGWRLRSVEPAWHAAERASKRLVGGLPSLIQQAPQDWQFRLSYEISDPGLQAPGPYAVRQKDALEELLASPVGPRLVACGLALKAWT
jgi:Type IV pilus assembly protein PilM